MFPAVPDYTGDNRTVNTLQLKVDPARLDSAHSAAALDHAAAILRGGGLVALPTETVYGLGANALDAEAVQSIFAAKRRPSWDPIIVHIAPLDRLDAMLEGLVKDVPEAAQRLMHAFWPGPLTLLLPRSAAVPNVVTAGRPLVGIRMPSHPVALELIRRAGVPIAAPSANVFGHTSPTTAAHVLEDLDGRIDAVIDAGPTIHGVESTVLDPNQTPMAIYRPGAITAEQIGDVAGQVTLFGGGEEPIEAPTGPLASPGLGLRHYAPRARLVLVESAANQLGRELTRAAAGLPDERVGIMLPAEVAPPPEGWEIYSWGSWRAPEELARNLYAGLRALDARGCSVIVCPVPQGEGIGTAIRDRLRKAAHQSND
jgi:L-threonylcarbamoyladenylate synthase